MEEKFFTTEQVANILQVHPFTILKFIKVGKLKGIKLGRVYRIKQSDVENFLENMTTGHGGKKPMTKDAKPEEVMPPPEAPEKEAFKLKSPDKKDEEHYYLI
ncbi:helix-turn-helix domain-containing protein [Candidatus Peregrinibacteria bacterium]|nr:helix-turn-helix domain-containing protein [Candidatus Peregrinibacteria bacterium]